VRGSVTRRIFSKSNDLANKLRRNEDENKRVSLTVERNIGVNELPSTARISANNNGREDTEPSREIKRATRRGPDEKSVKMTFPRD